MEGWMMSNRKCGLDSTCMRPADRHVVYCHPDPACRWEADACGECAKAAAGRVGIGELVFQPCQELVQELKKNGGTTLFAGMDDLCERLAKLERVVMRVCDGLASEWELRIDYPAIYREEDRQMAWAPVLIDGVRYQVPAPVAKVLGAQPAWRRVLESEPEMGVPVLVRWMDLEKKMPFMDVLVRTIDCWRTSHGARLTGSGVATHWMPLPSVDVLD